MVWPEVQRGASTKWFLQSSQAITTTEPSSPTINPIPDDDQGDDMEEDGGRSLPFHRLLGRAHVPVEAMKLCLNGSLLLGFHNGGIEMWNGAGERVRVLEGHAARVTSLAVGRQRAASGSEDRSVKVWELIGGRLIRTLSGHLEGVTCVALNDLETRVISGSEDKTIRVFDVVSGELLRTLRGHTQLVACVCLYTPPSPSAQAGTTAQHAWSPGTVVAVSGSHDRSVKVWCKASGRCLRTLKGHSHSVACVAVCPRGAFIASGGRDSTVCIWELATGHLLHSLSGHSHTVKAVAWKPDKGRGVLASAGLDGVVCLWALETGRRLRTLAGHTSGVTSVEWEDDGTALFTAGWDRSVRVWELAGGEGVRVLRGHGDSVTCLHLLKPPTTPDPETSEGDDTGGLGLIVSGSWDETVRVWDAASGMALDCLCDNGRVGDEGGDEEAGGPSMATGGGVTLSGNTVMFRVLRQSKVHVVSVHASADGKYLAAASSSDKGVRVWESGSGRLVQSLHLDDAPAVLLLSPPRGTLILTAGQEGTLCLWARQSGQLRRAIATGHVGGVTCAAGDGAWGVVVTGGAEGELRLWRGLLDEEQGEGHSQASCVLLGERHVGGVASVAVTPDGARALSGGADGRVRLWDVARAELLRMINIEAAAPGDSSVQCVDMSHDAGVIAAGCRDRKIRVWIHSSSPVSDDGPAAGHSCVPSKVLEGHRDHVRALCVSGDGGSLVSASQDRSLRVWDLRAFPTPNDFLTQMETVWLPQGSLNRILSEEDGPMGLASALAEMVHAPLGSPRHGSGSPVSVLLEVARRAYESEGDGYDWGPLLRLLQRHPELMLMWDDAGDSDVPQAVSLLGLALQFDDEHLVRGTLEAMAALVERRGHQAFACVGYEAGAEGPGGERSPLLVTEIRRALMEHPRDASEAMGTLWDFVLGPPKLSRRHLGGKAFLTRGSRFVTAWPWDEGGDEGRYAASGMSGKGKRRGQRDAGAPVVEGCVVPLPGLCGQGPGSFLAACLHAARLQSSTELFEKPVLVSIIAYKWGAYGRSLLVLLVALSVLLALNLTAYNLTITLRLGIGSRLLWTAYLLINATPLVLVEVLVCQAHLRAREPLSAWAVYKLVTYTALAGVLGLRLSNQHSDFTYTVLGVVSMFLWLKLLYYFRGFRTTAGLLRTMMAIVSDLRYFILVLCVTIIAFGNGFYMVLRTVLQGNDGVDNDVACRDNTDELACLWTQFGTSYRTLLSLFNAMLGNYDTNLFLTSASTRSTTIVLYIVYLLTQNIVMLNLLIAIMGDSYDRVQANVRPAWRCEQAKLLLEFEYLLSMVLPRQRLQAIKPRWLHVLRERSNSRSVKEDWSGRISAISNEVRRELVTFKQHLDGRDQVTSSAMHTLTQKVEHARAALEAVTRLMQAKEEEASRPLGNKRGPLTLLPPLAEATPSHRSSLTTHSPPSSPRPQPALRHAASSLGYSVNPLASVNASPLPLLGKTSSAFLRTNHSPGPLRSSGGGEGGHRRASTDGSLSLGATFRVTSNHGNDGDGEEDEEEGGQDYGVGSPGASVHLSPGGSEGGERRASGRFSPNAASKTVHFTDTTSLQGDEEEWEGSEATQPSLRPQAMSQTGRTQRQHEVGKEAGAGVEGVLIDVGSMLTSLFSPLSTMVSDARAGGSTADEDRRAHTDTE